MVEDYLHDICEPKLRIWPKFPQLGFSTFGPEISTQVVNLMMNLTIQNKCLVLQLLSEVIPCIFLTLVTALLVRAMILVRKRKVHFISGFDFVKH